MVAVVVALVVIVVVVAAVVVVLVVVVVVLVAVVVLMAVAVVLVAAVVVLVRGEGGERGGMGVDPGGCSQDNVLRRCTHLVGYAGGCEVIAQV